MNRVLIVEDDRVLAETLQYNLNRQDYCAEIVCSLAEAEAVRQRACKTKNCEKAFRLLILDVNLPDGESYDLCRRWKEAMPETAVIFLTARDLENDMLKGFAQGADDYITKPFPISVLKKKIERILGRNGNDKKQEEEVYRDVRLNLSFKQMKAELDGKSVSLTALEFRLLKILTETPKTVVTRRRLLELLWDADGNFVDEHTLTSAVSRIRSKLERNDYPAIKTVYGMGYMWIGGETE